MTEYQRSLLTDTQDLLRSLRDEPLTVDEATLALNNACDKASALQTSLDASERSEGLLTVLRDVAVW